MKERETKAKKVTMKDFALEQYLKLLLKGASVQEAVEQGMGIPHAIFENIVRKKNNAITAIIARGGML